MPTDVITGAPAAEETRTIPNDFAAYEAMRQKETNNDFAAVPEPEVVTTPEADAPAPSTEQKTEAAAPSAPETPPAESAPTESNQEDKDKDKPKGIPQHRFDEVTRARRDAERDRDAEKARADELQRQLEAMKAAPPPAEPPKPEVTEAAPAEKPKPVAPEVPTLEKHGGDWDEYEKALKTYHENTYPEYVEQLADWKQDQREIARQKAESAKPATTPAPTKPAESTWEADIQAKGSAKYPDWNEKIAALPQDPARPVSSPAMFAVLQDMDAPEDVIHYLLSNPEEAIRIAAATPHQEGQPEKHYRRVRDTASRELFAIESRLQAQKTTPPATPATPPATPAASTPPASPAPTSPENPKPATSRAPRPPSPVADLAPAPETPANQVSSFEEYEKRRLQTLRRR